MREYHDSEERNPIGRYFTIAVLSHIREAPFGPPLCSSTPIFSPISTIIVLAQLGASSADTVRRPLVWFTIIKADLTFRRNEKRAIPSRSVEYPKRLSLFFVFSSSFPITIHISFFSLLFLSVSLPCSITRTVLFDSGGTRPPLLKSTG